MALENAITHSGQTEPIGARTGTGERSRTNCGL